MCSSVGDRSLEPTEEAAPCALQWATDPHNLRRRWPLTLFGGRPIPKEVAPRLSMDLLPQLAGTMWCSKFVQGGER